MSLQPENLPSQSVSTFREDLAHPIQPPISAAERPIVGDDTSGAASGRAIVLIPNTDIDSESLRQALNHLGVSYATEIVLLGSDNRRDRSRSGKLYRLAFLLRTSGTPVTCQMMMPDETWVSAVRRIARTGDLVVCHAEYQGHKLSQVLSSEAGAPVYVLSGLYPTLPQRGVRLIGRAVFEVIPLVIIVGTFWLQVQLSEQTTGVVNTIALILSVLFEMGLILIWSLFIP